ncbi:MAG: YigZ family protein [Bacteroidota bacterium]
MAESTDTFKTIDSPANDAIFKDRGSKFLGYAFPVSAEEEIQYFIDQLKSEHHKARHWCYAWRIGKEIKRFRANDDGEPNNSAGQPIYGQILSYDLTNVLVVVVRYFGGTKLGVGGLINAYKTSAKLVLENAKIVKKTIDTSFSIQFEYKDMNKVMRLIKEKNIHLIDQKMEMQCDFLISVRKKDALQVKNAFEDLRCVKIKEVV